MGKNVVICCDGTGNEYRAKHNTNIVKFFRVLDKSDSGKQVVYYDPGVGTIHATGSQTVIAKAISKLLGLAFGYGISRNMADAYLFLMRNYEPKDRVYLFGFSRRAYTVRALAGMLHFCGLLRLGSENLIPYALKVHTERKIKRPTWARGIFLWPYYPLRPLLWLAKYTEPDWHRAAGFKKTFSLPCDPYFVGVWDTVKSVGWFRRRVVLPHTANHPKLRFGRHAVSIDE